MQKRRINGSKTPAVDSLRHGPLWWIHVHHLQTDQQAMALKRAKVEFCCHGCHGALVIDYPVPPPGLNPETGQDALLVQVARAFHENHLNCCPRLVLPGHECPAERRLVHRDTYGAILSRGSFQVPMPGEGPAEIIGGEADGEKSH